MGKVLLRELEISRGIAILGVMLIHVTSQMLMETPVQSRSYPFYAALNRLGHFSVPMFIFLSGLVLFYRYFEHWNYEQCLAFYRKRLKYILIPYIFWSTFYYFFNHSFENTADLSLRTYFLDLITGGAEYHLYYIILIIQYYLLLPVLFTLLQKVNVRSVYLILLSVAVQAVIGFLNSKYLWFADKSILCSTYITSFIIGCLAGKHYHSVSAWIQKYVPWLLTSSLFFLLLHLIIGQLEIMGRPIHAALKEIIVHLFSILTALTTLRVASIIHSKFAATLSAYGRYSLAIYFIHPAVLLIAEKWLNFPYSSPMYHPSEVIRMIIILMIPLSLVLSLKRFKWTWAIFGK